jgi:hypothetical protein
VRTCPWRRSAIVPKCISISCLRKKRVEKLVAVRTTGRPAARVERALQGEQALLNLLAYASAPSAVRGALSHSATRSSLGEKPPTSCTPAVSNIGAIKRSVSLNRENSSSRFNCHRLPYLLPIPLVPSCSVDSLWGRVRSSMGQTPVVRVLDNLQRCSIVAFSEITTRAPYRPTLHEGVPKIQKISSRTLDAP